ncbi:hypothetical protein A2U01_0111537, partial [Trifolium medium]|nr:hypothetical protein [Trifolium medium]
MKVVMMQSKDDMTVSSRDRSAQPVLVENVVS